MVAGGREEAEKGVGQNVLVLTDSRVADSLTISSTANDEPNMSLAKSHPFRDRFAAQEQLVAYLLERIVACEHELKQERDRTQRLVSDIQGIRKDLVRKNDDGLKRQVDRAMATMQAHMVGHR